MRVLIRVYASLRESLGASSVHIELSDDRATLLDVLKADAKIYEAVQRYPTERMIILVDGINIKLLGGLETPVRDGSVIDIFPPAAGGFTLP